MKSVPSRPNAMRDVPGEIRDEDVANLGERLAVPPSAGNRDRPPLLVERLGVGEIDEPVLGKSRVEGDIHEAVNRPG